MDDELYARLKAGAAQALAGLTHDLGDFKQYLDDECVDSGGQPWPEHDYPPQGEGNECRRCGAETED